MPGPLAGLRVLDFGRFIAAPYCAMLLADFGADVIRIERREGGEDRGLGPVTAAGDGQVTLGAYLLYGSARLDAQAKVLPGTCYYAGSVLSDGVTAQRVAGVTKGEASVVRLAQPQTAAELNRAYGAKVVSIWAYGVGDEVELPQLSAR